MPPKGTPSRPPRKRRAKTAEQAPAQELASTFVPPVVQGTPAPSMAVLVDASPVDAPAPPLDVGGRKQVRRSLTGDLLVLAMANPWNARFEKMKAGALGAAFVAAPMLELVAAGRLKVERDQFVVVPGPPLPTALEEVARELAAAPLPTKVALGRVARRLLPELLWPWKLRLEESGVLSLDRRGRVVRVVDEDAQGALENRLVRLLAGSGVIQAQDILLLGLAMASGLLPRFVPPSALPFNEKRIRALLAGRDTMDYRIDSALRGIQTAAVAAILDGVQSWMAP
ncbi:MAG: GPP34 family phosphoprotein [Thermoplasmatota archaeon]